MTTAKKSQHLRSAAILLSFSFVYLTAVAQSDSLTKKESRYYINNDDRKWNLSLPIWIPGFRGDFSFGDLESSTSESEEEKERTRIEDVIGIEFYFVGSANYVHNKWSLYADGFTGTITEEVFYDKLRQGDPASVIKLRISGAFFRFVAGYSVWRFEKENSRIDIVPYIGLRRFDIGLEAALFDSIYSGSVNPAWNEFIAGIYIPVKWKRYSFTSRFDFGRTDENISWMANIFFGYRISPLIDMNLGWSHLVISHEEVVRDEKLELNLRLTGPTLSVGFNF